MLANSEMLRLCRTMAGGVDDVSLRKVWVWLDRSILESQRFFSENRIPSL